MSFEDFTGARGQGRVNQDRAGLDCPGTHENDEVRKQFLRPLHRERWYDKRSVGMVCSKHLIAQLSAAILIGDIVSIDRTVRAFAYDVVQIPGAVGVELQELVAGPNVT